MRSRSGATSPRTADPHTSVKTTPPISASSPTRARSVVCRSTPSSPSPRLPAGWNRAASAIPSSTHRSRIAGGSSAASTTPEYRVDGTALRSRHRRPARTSPSPAPGGDRLVERHDGTPHVAADAGADRGCRGSPRPRSPGHRGRPHDRSGRRGRRPRGSPCTRTVPHAWPGAVPPSCRRRSVTAPR